MEDGKQDIQQEGIQDIRHSLFWDRKYSHKKSTQTTSTPHKHNLVTKCQQIPETPSPSSNFHTM